MRAVMLVAVVGVLLGSPLRADGQTSAPKSPTAKAERLAAEAAVLDFARQHHPELADLLLQLRSDNPKEFEQAIGDLARTRDRLERLREKMPERYELELAAWKLDSRIRLLAARLAMSDDPVLEKELRAALRQRVEVRARLLLAEKERIEARLQTIEKTLAELTTHADDVVDREFARLQQSLGQAKRPQGRSAADAPKPKKPASSAATSARSEANKDQAK